jgi:hypothetical protein
MSFHDRNVLCDYPEGGSGWHCSHCCNRFPTWDGYKNHAEELGFTIVTAHNYKEHINWTR